MTIDIAIHKYGIEAFEYSILEECPIEALNSREEYWISYYNSKKNGYNETDGGEQQSVGENNGRAILTEEDVRKIRQAYNEHKRQKDVYEFFKDKISFTNFQTIWQGKTWTHIMPEVYTEENKKYYSVESCVGSKGQKAVLSDEDVMAARERYVSEDARTIYEDYKDRMKYQTFQAMLWGRTYKNLPIYKKKEQTWINT